MAEVKRVLAFDFGASSGRAVVGTFDGCTIHMEEVHRFSNDPVMVRHTMYWDVLRLFHEIKQGLSKAYRTGPVASIGIDTWGVDFGLLDKRGYLLENPVHYRDSRTNDMLGEAAKLIDSKELYDITGNQIMSINTLFQLLSLAKQRPEVLEHADTLLFMPDLFNYMLCGVKAAEYTIASTSQMFDAEKHEWSQQLLKKFRLPASILPQIIEPASCIGTLDEAIVEELGLTPAKIVAVAGHDTQSAMAAVPTEAQDFLFLSCGTWSLLGTELERPVINEASAAANITNEGGYGGKTSFLKNIIGLWLIQECRRQWMREGKEYSFGELEQMACEAEPFQAFIHPDASEFVPSGNMPERICAYCKRTGQKVPDTIGGIVRCIDESLALRYRQVTEELETCLGKTYPCLHMIGGGIQSRLLCQMTANACQRPVVAGPVEATVLGNIALQLLADGAIKDIQEARRIIKASEAIKTYQPQQAEVWNEIYHRWEDVTSC
ncbi:rhamnulokinase [Mitsuokella sp.]|uniref:rhamnulokinase n=1 Tax=Mitsuokella sp. TaxID=2049034 RepID=UPI003D7DA296